MSAEFRFDLGTLAFDFSATLGKREGDTRERLPDAAALGRWCRDAALSRTQLRPTAREFSAALALREAIYRIGAALARDTPVRRDDLAELNAAARAFATAPQLVQRTGRVAYDGASPVASALGRIARDAIETFGGEPRDAIRLCEGADCAALVLSSSRAAPRRWCSMATCGNRAKVAAFRERTRRG